MIKAMGDAAGGRKVLLLGLSSQNWSKLLEGKPIHFNGEEVGLEKLDVIILGAENYEVIRKHLEPYINDKTMVSHIDKGKH